MRCCPSRRNFLLAAAAAVAARGQDATFSTDVKVVNILATVRTKKGEMVRDLEKQDFSVAENGRPQTIRYFARQTDLPLTLGLMVDTSASQEKVIEPERIASFRFIDQVLREDKDHVFLMQFDTSIQLRQPLTSSHRKLNEVLPFVDTQTRKELQTFGGETRLFDAVVQASKDIMKAQTGRKALIVLSDGVDTGSEATIAQAIEAAQRADTLIYSILFSDAGAYGIFGAGTSGRNALMRMSRETGAGFFEVSKKLTLEQIFTRLEEELRSQYAIGYVSDQPVVISEFRKIQLAAGKGTAVQARDSYWAQR